MAKLHGIRMNHTGYQASFTANLFESQTTTSTHSSNLISPDNSNFYKQLILISCHTVLSTLYFHHTFFITATRHYYFHFTNEGSEENYWITCLRESSKKQKGWDLNSHLSVSSTPTVFRHISNSRPKVVIYTS